MKKPTYTQLLALADLSDGTLKYGISIRGRHALPSLRKLGYVSQCYGEGTADQWQIRLDGLAVLKKFGTIRHLRNCT